MRTAGAASWQITTDVPQVLAVALYIRDVAGVAQTASPVGLAEVVPSVTRAGTAPALPEVTAQWNSWWARALTTGPDALEELEPPHFSTFADATALQDLLRAHLHAALRWSSEVKRSSALATRGGLPLGKLVSEIEHRTGRVARPFRLRLDVVPVAGRDVWTVGHAHVLMSSALLDDPELLVAKLRPAVEVLV